MGWSFVEVVMVLVEVGEEQSGRHLGKGFCVCVVGEQEKVGGGDVWK